MRVLWRRAPFVLRRHPQVLAALVGLAALAAVAASSVPLVRAGVESESLKSELRTMSPLAAGLEIQSAGLVRNDPARRRAAAAFARRPAFLGAPVDATILDAGAVNTQGTDLDVRVVARTDATAHVHRLAGPARGEAWISEATAKVTGAAPGGILVLRQQGLGEKTPVRLRVAAVYRDLDEDQGNPYWANWLQDIRHPDPNAPPPPPFVLVSEGTLLRIAPRLSRFAQERFEFPVDPSHVTYAGARRLRARFAALAREAAAGAPSLRGLGCGPRGRGFDTCTATSSLGAALTVAADSVAAVAPTVSLLSDSGLVIALGLSVAAGIFLVRRRSDEVHVVFVRGESPLAFALRTALEALLPAALGAAAGFGGALLVLRALAPSGSIDGATWTSGAARAAVGGVLAVVATAVGAATAFPRRDRARHRLGRLPWEVVPLAAAAALFAVAVSGRGLARDANGFSHPRLVIFVLPVVAAVGVAALAARAGRVALRGRFAASPPQPFLAARRLAAARGLLVAVVVAAAASFAMFAYALTLSSSLTRSSALKAYVANGSDVQAVVDPATTIDRPLGFPAVIAELDQEDAFLDNGAPVDILAADPAALARTLEFDGAWSGDPRPLLPKLARADRGAALAAIASPGAPAVRAIVDQGKRIPVHVVGHAELPAATAGRPALLVDRARLRSAARRASIADPGPGASGLLWARGPAQRVERALAASNLGATFFTTPNHIFSDGSVAAAKRSYGYVKVIGAAAAVLSLLALLLYLQARQRGQALASAFARRMGLAPTADVSALVVEAVAIVLFAAVLGTAVALLTAGPIVGHVDALPQYAPSPVLVVPWTALAAATGAAALAAALVGAAAAALAARADASEALRVA